VVPSQLLAIEVLRRPLEFTLHAAVAMVDEPGKVALALPEGHLQGVEGKVGSQVVGRLPAADEAAESIKDEGHTDKPRPGAHGGQVGDPEAVRGGGGTVALHEIVGTQGALIGSGRKDLLATHNAS
jgi:hypothetical protein